MTPEFKVLWDQADEREQQYREQHKHDPCKFCRANLDISIIPIGNLAKLTPLCRICRDKLSSWTKGYHEGFAHGQEYGRNKGLFKRIFKQ